MTIQESMNSIAEDIARQAKRLVIYQEVAQVFNGIKIPYGIHIHISQLLSSGTIWIQFSVSSLNDDVDKDVRPLVHAIARRFHAKFNKSKNWDGVSLKYETKFKFEDKNFDVEITGAVPKTCQIVEKTIPLTDEEIEAARQAALANVKLERVEREIVCSTKSGTI